jgi:hypothetical protein
MSGVDITFRQGPVTAGYVRAGAGIAPHAPARLTRDSHG